MELNKLYKARFSGKELMCKNAMWSILCRCYFQKLIKSTDTVLDLGAGYCEFINNIKCGRGIAVDVNSDVSLYANKTVEIFLGNCDKLDFIANDSIDVIFISNLLEHFDSKEEIIRTLKESRRILKSGGIIMMLQPNIRFLYREYWDFFDHKIPLSDRSIVEALALADLRCVKVIPRFLPYTSKCISSLVTPIIKPLIRIYLRIPLLWMIFGKQMFIVASKY